MTADEILTRLEGVTKNGTGWKARCPGHEDKSPSLSVCEGNDGRVLLKCYAGCNVNSICHAIGIRTADLFPNAKANGQPKRSIAATYPYHDEHGAKLFEVVRFEPKGFSQRQDDHTWNMKGVRRVPFMLPEVLEAVKAGRPVYIVEGEKDVLALKAEGFTATCNPGGAGKWLDDYGPHFKGAEVVIVADADEPGRKHAQQVAAMLHPVAKLIRVIETPSGKDVAEFLSAGGDMADLDGEAEFAPVWTPQGGADPLPGNEDEPAESQGGADRIHQLLAGRRFDFTNPPPAVHPVYSVNGIPICTPGNLTGITAAIKSGKSSWISAMMAAVMTADPEADCFGVQSSNPDGKALIHVDTEQSRQDWHAIVSQALVRARVDRQPAWLVSYHLTGFTFKEARQALEVIMQDEAVRCVGIHSVFIDGVADLVPSVNDEEESNAFVAHLHGQAIEYDCPIIGAIHFNPGSDKTRGHLGSQLERKAETNLKLEKSEEVITVYSEKSRKAPITKDTGPRFAWDEQAGMHRSVATLGKSRADEKRETMRIEAEAVLTAKGSSAARHGEFIALLMSECGFNSKSTAKRRLGSMLMSGVLRKDLTGLYALND